MTINATDVKILKSERLTDFDDGGGKMTGLEVVDGVMNNLFPDISRLDRTYGRVSLRKAFLAIQSNNVDPYYGAHAIITEPPADDAVTVTMFSTGSYADERTNARDRIESYLTPSIESRFVLFGNHLRGSRVVSVWVADITVPSPDVGSVFALRHLDRVTDDETAILLDIQYERVQRVVSRTNGNFVVPQSQPPRKVNVDVIVMEVSSTLHADFPGFPPTDESGSPAKTKLQLTSATDAAQYYGVTRLAANATAGSSAVTVADIFANLVPSAQSEVAVIDQPGAAALLVAAAAAPSSISQAAQYWPGGVDSVSYFPRAFVPGTFTLDGAAFDNGRGVYDDGLVRATLDYPSGKVTARPASGVSRTMTAIPAAPMSQSGYTSQFLIDASTRSYNYVLSLAPLPAPGSFYIDYKAQGNWYRLRDDGIGHLAGDLTSYGSGAIDYTTGSVVFTAAVLPDANTALLYGWGSRENLEILTGQGSSVADHMGGGANGSIQSTQADLVIDPNGNTHFTIGNGITAITPGTVQFDWLETTGAYNDQFGQVANRYDAATATDDGLTGDLKRATDDDPAFPAGSLNYTTGAVTLRVTSDHFVGAPYGPSVLALRTA